jgi:hypothetical protein
MTPSGSMNWTCPTCRMEWHQPIGEKPRHKCEAAAMRSIVGLRVTWFCARCLKREQTYQIVPAGPVTPDLPHGWTVENGFTLCGCCATSDSVGPRAQFDTAEFRAA